MELIQDFKELLESLNANQVEYLVVGGYAVIMHGYPRMTVDIDVWVNPTIENSKKTIKAIKDFGFEFHNLTEKDFEKSDNIIQLGRPPYRVDILTSIEGMDFKECYNKKFVYKKNNLLINFISKEDLLINKRLVGRDKDKDDFNKLR